jgi:uncharacterized RDD family membrane protein YckC
MGEVPATESSTVFAQEATHHSFKRYLAHLVDGLLIGAIGVFLLIPASIISNTAAVVVLGLWVTLIPFGYYVLTQRGDGQSPGKGMAGLKIVDREGAPPTTGALVRRTLPLLVEYLYVIAWVSMMASPYRQRLGDRWARTYVVADESA